MLCQQGVRDMPGTHHQVWVRPASPRYKGGACRYVPSTPGSVGGYQRTPPLPRKHSGSNLNREQGQATGASIVSRWVTVCQGVWSS